MIEINVEFPQNEVIQATAEIDNETHYISDININAKPEITEVTASVDNNTGTPYVDVTPTGTGTEYSFNLAFHNLKGEQGEQGETGQDGQAATVTVGTTTTGDVGTDASVVNSGTSSAAILNFTIPRGNKGETGATGETGADGYSPTATVSQSDDVTTITITDKNGTTTESIDLSDYALKSEIPTKTSELTNDSGFVVNTATGSNSLTIFGTAATAANAINIGATSSMAGGTYSVAMGYGAKCNSSSAVAIGRATSVGSNSSNALALGYNAKIGSSVNYAIQLGSGTNNTSNSLAVGFDGTNYELLDGTTGKIPDDRLNSTIARISDLAEVATSGDYDDLINKPIIDTELSTTSTNAVQNSVITQALQNIDVDTLIPVTYAELVELKTNSQLKAGAFYRITDFVTTTNGYSPDTNEPSRSAGHPFDLIIQALGESNLSDICTAALHEGDTYFANNNLGAWQIWYDIENNVSKYAWGDTTNGKGVIYRLIDEFGNDLSFDFKNIQFYRDKTLAKYSTIASYLTSSDNYYYVFSKNTSGTVTDKSLNANTHDNIIGAYISGSNTRYLENTIFVHTSNTVTDTNTIGTVNYNNTCCGNFYGNSIDMLFYNNIIANNFYYNNIGAVFRDNKIGENFLRNTIVGVFYENTIDEYFYQNEVGYVFYGNTIGEYFYGNKTCSDFYSNTIPLNSHNNFFGTRFYNNTGSATTNGIQQSTFGAVVYNCTFGEKFQRNSIGNFAMNCVFGNNNAGITIGNNNAFLTFSNNVQSCIVFNRCGYVNVTIPMVIIYSQIVGSSNTNRFTTSGLPTGGAYPITIKTDSNGAVLATYNDGANEIGYKKATVTTSAWSELLPTFTWEGS